MMWLAPVAKSRPYGIQSLPFHLRLFQAQGPR